MNIPVQDITEPMFCFETAFKLLTLSYAAYTNEDPLVGCEQLCTLHKMHPGASDDHSLEATVIKGGECRCSHGFNPSKLQGLKEVCNIQGTNCIAGETW